jgi:hypothetical protein
MQNARKENLRAWLWMMTKNMRPADLVCEDPILCLTHLFSHHAAANQALGSILTFRRACKPAGQ